MTPTNLLKSLAAAVVEATAGLKLPTEYMREPAREVFVKVNVFEQYLPADLFEETTYFPMAAVELLTVRDELKRNVSTAEVAISCGTYAKEANGWRDCFHLLEVIRQSLLRRRIIGERFRLIGDVVLSFPDEQPTPFFFGYLNMEYQTYLPQEENLPI